MLYELKFTVFEDSINHSCYRKLLEVPSIQTAISMSIAYFKQRFDCEESPRFYDNGVKAGIEFPIFGLKILISSLRPTTLEKYAIEDLIATVPTEEDIAFSNRIMEEGLLN